MNGSSVMTSTVGALVGRTIYGFSRRDVARASRAENSKRKKCGGTRGTGTGGAYEL